MEYDKDESALALLRDVMHAKDPSATRTELAAYLDQLTGCVEDPEFIGRYWQVASVRRSASEEAGRAYQEKVKVAEGLCRETIASAESACKGAIADADEACRQAAPAAEGLAYSDRTAAKTTAYTERDAAQARARTVRDQLRSGAYTERDAAKSRAYDEKTAAMAEARGQRDQAVRALLSDYGVALPELGQFEGLPPSPAPPSEGKGKVATLVQWLKSCPIGRP